MLRVASDVGGTFTDLVYFEIDEKTGKALNIKTAKSNTTPSGYEIGVFDTLNKEKVDDIHSIIKPGANMVLKVGKRKFLRIIK